MKRILSMLLAIVLMAALFPALPGKAEAKTGGKLAAITFEDGPSGEYTEQLLDGLKARGVKATFFMLGEMAAENRDIVRRAYEEGHEIACHTWDHEDLRECTDSTAKKQIEDTLEELDRACGDEADYLVRLPYDAADTRLLNLIDAPFIAWSVDSADGSLLNAEKVSKKIVEGSYDGCIILCHDILRTTIPAALDAIDELMELGYEFVTVSELYRRRGRELEEHTLYTDSKNNGVDCGPIPAPVITVAANSKGGNTVTLTCGDGNAPLYYTLDGSFPDENANRYTGPFTVSTGTRVTAVAAYKLNGSRSEVTQKVATNIRVVAPTITLDSNGDVVMTTPTTGGEIYFTVDNTAPNADSLVYTGPEFIAGGCFLRAVTVHADAGVSPETKAYLSEDGDLYYDMYAGQWFYEAMDWTHRMEILNGTAPYTMSPAGVVTRGMLVTLLYRFSGDSLEADWKRVNKFRDVNQSYYYAEAIEWAYRNHIVDGYSTYAFGPDDAVTRQQMCKIVASFLTWLETPLSKGASCAGVFGDYAEIADWAVESVEAMVAAGLIQGDGTNMNPNDGANRAQFCVLLVRLAEYIDNYDGTEPEPSEPTEPTEPEHVHSWKLNKSRGTDPTKADVTINVAERFLLKITCQGEDCGESPDVEWIGEPDGVVLVDGRYITGITGGMRTTLRAEWDGVTFECIVRVRKDDSATEPTEPEPTEPEEPEHEHVWKLNKSSAGSLTDGDVSINVGEWFNLRVLCRVSGCEENAPVKWTASKEGVVSIDGMRITGLAGGKNTTLTTEWEDVTFTCIIRVRKNAAGIIPGIVLPE